MKQAFIRVLVVGFGAFFAGGEGHAERLKVVCPEKEILFNVEVAKTQEQCKKGLMFRTSLREDAGMLFLFSPSGGGSSSMWMKNTSLSLDMFFADGNGKILAVFERTTPYSLEQIGPVPQTVQVLEINAGLAKKHGIRPQACSIHLDQN